MSADRIAKRAAQILALARSHPRVRALSEAERLAWAHGQAERDLAAEAWLPGGFAWSQIEAAYRELAAGPPRHPFKRRRSDQPSRPELAARLGTSPATLDRACIMAGRGGHWPPRGL